MPDYTGTIRSLESKLKRQREAVTQTEHQLKVFAELQFAQASKSEPKTK